MDKIQNSAYEEAILGRSSFRYYIGFVARLKNYIPFVYARWVARKLGASIGKEVNIPLSLAKKATGNLSIGDYSTIHGTSTVDLRSPVKIGKNVIISGYSKIVTTSHYIDSPDWEHKYYGITIDDYVWIAQDVLILPSCRHIGYGAVIGSGSVVVKDVEPMSVVSGNPARELKKRKCVHSELVVESLNGGDFKRYIEIWKSKKHLIKKG